MKWFTNALKPPHLNEIKCRADHGSRIAICGNGMDLFTKPILRKRAIKTMPNAPQNEQQMHDKIDGNDMNSDLSRACKQGRVKEAMQILYAMDCHGVPVDSSTYASLLQVSVNKKALLEGKLLHSHMVQRVLELDTYLKNRLLILYAKCGSLVDARRVLDQMSERNVMSWTVMIAAYGRHGYGVEVFDLFYQMKSAGIEPNEFTFASILSACAHMVYLEKGKEIHEEVIKGGFESNVFVGNALADMFAKCGELDLARHVFDKMPEPDVVSWNTMIAGYAQNGQVAEAMKMFEKMPERNVVSWNAMIAGCGQNGFVDEALDLFCQMPEPDVVSWTAMIAAYAKQGYGHEALNLYCKMQQSGVRPNRNTFASLLLTCASLSALERGKEIHEEIIRSGFHYDVNVGNSLIDMYAKCGSIENALVVFDKMPKRDLVSWNVMIAAYAQSGCVEEALKIFSKIPIRDVVSWNAMIAAYAQNGHHDEALKMLREMPEQDAISWNAVIAGYAQAGYTEDALKLFQQMLLAAVKPNAETFTVALPACSDLAALEEGREIHEAIIRSGYNCDTFVGSALVDMYSKCGCIENAQKVFDHIQDRDVVLWTAMIVGYAIHGYAKEALELFEGMLQLSMNPNHVTFLGILSACCHAGLARKGQQFFDLMSQHYHITPAMEHYSCMVDLLGRAGRLNDAQELIKKMPKEPGVTVWGSLLNACRIHMNIELGEYAAKRLFEMDPENPSPYVQLSNIYAVAGMWSDVENVRKMMKARRLKKNPGCSWLVVSKQVYAFAVGDSGHLETEKKKHVEIL